MFGGLAEVTLYALKDCNGQKGKWRKQLCSPPNILCGAASINKKSFSARLMVWGFREPKRLAEPHLRTTVKNTSSFSDCIQLFAFSFYHADPVKFD